MYLRYIGEEVKFVPLGTFLSHITFLFRLPFSSSSVYGRTDILQFRIDAKAHLLYAQNNSENTSLPLQVHLFVDPRRNRAASGLYISLKAS